MWQKRSYMILSFIILLLVGPKTVRAEQGSRLRWANQTVFSGIPNFEADLINGMIKSYNPKLSREQTNLICETVLFRSKQFRLDPLLLASVIAVESSYRPEAVSSCAAKGLMQITSGVIRMMGIRNPYDIRENIFAGAKYLYQLSQSFRNLELVLAAYNAGPTRVARLKSVPEFKETRLYVKKVKLLYRNLTSLYWNNLRLAVLPYRYE